MRGVTHIRRRDVSRRRNCNRWGLPRRTGSELRQAWWKRERRKARAALSASGEPAPARPRHSVRYDYW